LEESVADFGDLPLKLTAELIMKYEIEIEFVNPDAIVEALSNEEGQLNDKLGSLPGSARGYISLM
jgi:hypothetical protein